MENILFTQLSVSEIEAIVSKAVEASFAKHHEHGTKEEDKDIMLNVEEASKLLQVAKPTIYRYTSDNVVPHIKMGRKLLFVKADLLTWLKERRRTSVAELSKRENFFKLNTRKKAQ